MEERKGFDDIVATFSSSELWIWSVLLETNALRHFICGQRRLYYRRVEEGKQYPVLCRRLASLNEEFISNRSPSASFNFMSGSRSCLITIKKLKDLEVMPMKNYQKSHLITNTLLTLSWAKNGQALLYVVTDDKKRPFRIYCSMLGSDAEDVIILEEPLENVHLNIRHTKNFQFFTVNVFTTQSSKVFLINAADPLSGMTLVWEGDSNTHCIIEHHQGYLCLFTGAAMQGKPVDHHYLLRSPVASPCSPRNWENVFAHDPQLIIVDVDFCNNVFAHDPQLIIVDVGAFLKDFNPQSLPLPDHMPDAEVDYDLLNGKWTIVQQQNLLYERTRVLAWHDLSEYYACEEYDVPSHDGALVPFTILYSRHRKNTGENPGLLHGHGAYGEILDKRWRNELKSLLDRGWVIAYADVRGGGGGGRKWFYDGRRTKKLNSIKDYISCAKFLIEREIVGETQLACWGYSTGGLLVASAINFRSDLFRAAVLKFTNISQSSSPTINLSLIVTHVVRLGDIEDFRDIRAFSPYDNIQKDALYSAILVTSSFTTR
ncbi:Prolyl oligopeptidase family protein [Perilla frutescens var. hirtella]|nr:Prolyl oligopeptidase family protein [Perilla frutescens var. hirtella]